MISKSFANDLVVRELTKKEMGDLLDSHFEAVFKNRKELDIVSEISQDAKDKMRQRSQADNRYRLRLGAFIKEEFVGWHYGFSTDAETYYMQNSAVVEGHRGRGIYNALLKSVLEICQSEGFQVITSTHHANNAAVLIPKLRSGFIISGVQFHERFRFLVELRFIVDVQRRKQMGKNMGLEL